MSKHILEINFNELKFNLYELLAVPIDCSEQKIKKAYRKIIIRFHPDKNDLIDEEVYNHLTIANQVLTNVDLRTKYDEWLKSYGQESMSHSELKNNYKESNKNRSLLVTEFLQVGSLLGFGYSQPWHLHQHQQLAFFV